MSRILLMFIANVSIFSTPFFRLVVPTVDTVRYQYLVSTLIKSFNPVMMVGPVGTGKTSVIDSTLNKVDSKSYNVLTVNMSAQVGGNYMYCKTLERS